MAKYMAADVAAHIIEHCVSNGAPISNLQLQKILFFVQCNWIDRYSVPLFDDDFEAWQYGPMVPNVYRTYSIFGKRPIFQAARSVSNGIFDKGVREVIPLDDKTSRFVDEIVDKYSSMDAWALVDIAHEPGGAWDIAYKNHGRCSVISKSSMAAHPCGLV